MLYRMIKPFVLVIAATLASTAVGGEEKIPLESAPPAVQAAVRKALGTSPLEKLTKEAQDGKTVFEAEYHEKEVAHSVKISEAGDILEEETELAVKSLPAAVLEAVQHKYPGAEVEEASEVKAGGRTFFELSVEVGKQDREIQVDAKGAILSDKLEDDEADDKD